VLVRSITHRLCQKEIMDFRFNSEILEYGIRPEPLHMILRILAYWLPPDITEVYPVLNLSMSDWVVYAIT
jgi:hypothetical protein